MTKINPVQPASNERIDRFAALMQEKCSIPENWAYAILRSIDYWKDKGLVRTPNSASFEPKPNGDGYTFQQTYESASGQLFLFTLSSVYDTTKQADVFTETMTEV